MDLLANLSLGLSTALLPSSLLYCFLGVLLGTIIGVIPGIGVLAAISMLFPITFHLDATSALIMLAGIWYGTTYGGSTASILLNIPGTPANAVSCLDGYPMARQGRAGVALLMTTIASFIGGSIGIVILTLFSPIIAVYAIKISSAEYFALMLLGLVAASTISDGSAAKGLGMVVLGLLLATIGLDGQSGVARFTFGTLELLDGLSIVALAMGLFGVAEIVTSVRRIKSSDIDPKSARLSASKPTKEDIRESAVPMLRGAGIGSFFGALPGTGPSVAAFMTYAIEKRLSRTPEKFGKGSMAGLTAPEAANNSADQTSFIPTLSLGIPGSPTMALMLGALMIHGISPGPNLISEQPSLFWGLVMSFWIGNLMLVVLNVPMIGLWVRLLMVPYRLMYPAILMFICIGAYSVRYSSFDVLTVLAFGVLGYLMRVLALPAAPLLLGFVLGPLIEMHFRRAMIMARGDYMYFLERPVTATVLGLTVLVLIWSLWSGIKARKRERMVMASNE